LLLISYYLGALSYELRTVRGTYLWRRPVEAYNPMRNAVLAGVREEAREESGSKNSKDSEDNRVLSRVGGDLLHAGIQLVES
jgi:hypothetical protein